MALYDSEWSSNIMAITAGKVAIINVYISPGWYDSISADVKRLVRQAKEDGLDVIVVGDFNNKEGQIKKLARESGLQVCKSPNNGTRKGLEGKRSTIDFILTSAEMDCPPIEVWWNNVDPLIMSY